MHLSEGALLKLESLLEKTLVEERTQTTAHITDPNIRRELYDRTKMQRRMRDYANQNGDKVEAKIYNNAARNTIASQHKGLAKKNKINVEWGRDPTIRH